MGIESIAEAVEMQQRKVVPPQLPRVRLIRMQDALLLLLLLLLWQ